MPWLRDFMNGAEPSIPSFGKLARLCLDHPEWPRDVQPKPRSLSTLFSKLDRNQDLDWLRDRLEVQHVLAKLLKRPLGDIRSAIGETPYDSDPRFLRWGDIRYARELDCVREELPPGIPREVRNPPLWEPTWWWAPAGAGRSVNAQWLSARGLAHTAPIRGNDDLDQLPTRGPLFLDVDAQLSPSDLDLSPNRWEALRTHARPVCVAAPFPPPSGTTFSVVTSAPVSDYLPELVDWVQDRLDGSGYFRPDRAEQWVRRVAIPGGAVRTWGDALGLLGMLDELNPRSFGGKSLDELGAHFVRTRLREALDELSMGPRLAEHAFDALLSGAARLLVQGRLPLSSARALDEWTAFLSPPEHEDHPDPEWFTDALRGALGTRITRRDLRRAARKLKPGAFQLVRALETSGLLARTGPLLPRDEQAAERILRPRWLVTLLESRAFEEVLNLTPAAWGQVLFEGRDTDRIIAALHQRGQLGRFESLFQLIDEFDPGLNEHIAALEASVVVCGRLLLERYEVPDELAVALLELTAETMVIIDDVPRPRLALSRQRDPTYCSQAWLVGLTALTLEHPFPLRHLDPQRSLSAKLKAAVVQAHLDELAPSDKRVRLARARAVSVLDSLDRVTESDQERPLLFGFLEQLGTADRELFERARQQCPLDHLIQYVLEKGTSPYGVYPKIWRFLAHERDPESFLSTDGMQKELYRYLPSKILEQRVQAGLPVSWANILPHQFSEWLGSSTVSLLGSEAAAHCPLDALLAALFDRGPGAFSHDALRIVIDRAGARLGGYFKELFTPSRIDSLERFLDAIPRSKSADLLATLPDCRSLLQLDPRVVSLLRLLLLRVVHERHPGFEVSAQRMVEMEKELFALRKLAVRSP